MKSFAKGAGPIIFWNCFLKVENIFARGVGIMTRNKRWDINYSKKLIVVFCLMCLILWRENISPRDTKFTRAVFFRNVNNDMFQTGVWGDSGKVFPNHPWSKLLSPWEPSLVTCSAIIQLTPWVNCSVVNMFPRLATGPESKRVLTAHAWWALNVNTTWYVSCCCSCLETLAFLSGNG